MGFGDVAGPLAGVIKEDLQVSNFLSQLLPFMGYIMFGLLSIPLGILQDRKGKKFILLLGMIIALSGLILPTFGLYPVNLDSISSSEVIKYFLIVLSSVFFLGLANTTLQIAGNPIMRDVSSPGKYSRNLSIGQFAKAIGTLSCSLIPLAAVRWFNADWKLLFPVFSIIYLLALFLIWPMKTKTDKDKNINPASFNSCFSLLKNRFVLLMVFSIFLYVGIEVAMRSNITIYLKDQFNINVKKEGLAGVLFFDIALMAGRLLGGVVLNWIKPKAFFKISGFLSAIGLLGLFIASSAVANEPNLGFISAIVIGLGFANIFPLVFSITIDEIPERANELSGLMITAVVGGAFIPPLMGFVADSLSVLYGFLVPLVCILFIIFVAFNNTKKISLK